MLCFHVGPFDSLNTSTSTTYEILPDVVDRGPYASSCKSVPGGAQNFRSLHDNSEGYCSSSSSSKSVPGGAQNSRSLLRTIDDRLPSSSSSISVPGGAQNSKSLRKNVDDNFPLTDKSKICFKHIYTIH